MAATPTRCTYPREVYIGADPKPDLMPCTDAVFAYTDRSNGRMVRAACPRHAYQLLLDTMDPHRNIELVTLWVTR